MNKVIANILIASLIITGLYFNTDSIEVMASEQTEVLEESEVNSDEELETDSEINEEFLEEADELLVEFQYSKEVETTTNSHQYIPQSGTAIVGFTKVAEHVHEKGAYHTSVDATYTTEGTKEYYDCSNGCESKLNEDNSPYIESGENDNFHIPVLPITVSFNPNGGSNIRDSKEVKFHNLYGQNYSGYEDLLPSASRDNYQFLGWFTEIDAGNKVENSTLVEAEGNITLYAHWEADNTSEDNPPENPPENPPPDDHPSDNKDESKSENKPVEELSKEGTQTIYQVTLVKGNKLTELQDVLKKDKADGKGYLATTTDKNVATISSKGIIVAKGNGTCKIQVQKPGANAIYILNVTVSIPKFAQKSYTMNSEETLDLGFTGTTLKVTYNIPNNQQKFATIDDNGKLVAKAKGTVVVRAFVNGTMFKTKVKIYAPEIKCKDTIKLGKLIKLSVKNGVKQTTWKVENQTGEAQISSKGIIQGIRAGTVIVVAENNGKIVKKSITITE